MLPTGWLKHTIILIFLCALTGCSPVVESTQPAITSNFSLDNLNSIGQTFVANYNGLEGLQVYLSPQVNGDGNISLYLRSESTAGENLGVSRMPLASIKSAGYYRFDFPPLDLSRGQYYYAVLLVEGQGSLLVGVSSPDSYIDGSLYQNSSPIDGQLSFSLDYASGLVIQGIIRQVITWAGIIIIAFFLSN
jgi:hypothetical protein